MSDTYSEGTISIATGSHSVVGTDTYFKSIGLVKAGSMLTLDGNKYYLITDVVDDRHLTIEHMIDGTPFAEEGVGGASYTVVKNFARQTNTGLASDFIAFQNELLQNKFQFFNWLYANTERYVVNDTQGGSKSILTPKGIDALIADLADGEISGESVYITQAYYDDNTVTFDNLSANVNGLSVITSLVSTQTAITNNGTISKANSASAKADAAESFINGQAGTIQDLLSNYAQSSALSNYVTQTSYDANAITRDNLETEVNALGISGAATIAIETITNAGASQTINKTANSVIDMTLTQATTSITCATRSDAEAHTVTLILRQGSGANEVSWSGVAWPEGSPPLLTFEAGKFDVIDLLVTQNTVVGMYKGGWFA